MSAIDNKRNALRQPVLRAARILFGASAVDCLVLNLSPTGLRVSTEALMAFPLAVRVELTSGGVWDATRRWQRGYETGFEFTRFEGLHERAALEAGHLRRRLANTGVLAITGELARVGWFDDPALKLAARGAEVALAKLDRTLQIASQT